MPEELSEPVGLKCRRQCRPGLAVKLQFFKGIPENDLLRLAIGREL